MKSKKPTLEGVLIIILLLALAIFILINFKILNKKIDYLKEERTACKGLDAGDNCNFSMRGEEITGVCKEPRKGMLVCKPEGLFERGRK